MNPEDNHLLETIKSVITPIHPAGWPFIALFAIVSLILGLFWKGFLLLGIVATAWCIYFFRDPHRVTPLREGLIVRPGDGVVQKIVKCVPPRELELGIEERSRISIFLNVFDVHVNRIPIEGSITALTYRPGKFFNANLDKASEENEQQLIKITTPDGLTLGCVQIAGLVARRIICTLKQGQSVKTGERFGIIRFGSRVDIYLPHEAYPLVIVGQRAVGGETILADLKSSEVERVGTEALMRRRSTDKRPRFAEQPISRLFPNMVTIAGMCCGLSAIRFAMLGRFEFAVGFIIAAAIIDGMDGRIARMLGATSLFGAQLDSLSDFICFGVAPALVMYMWQLHDIQALGWAVTLFFSVCTALRLARFNTGLFDDKKEAWEAQFFTGVPSPAGGILCLLPLILALQLDGLNMLPLALIACHVVCVGALMVSRIPTFSGKKQRIKHETILPFMLICSIILVLFIIEPWLSLCLISLGYLASIYFSVRRWRQLKASEIAS